jgi:hypothetical protein
MVGMSAPLEIFSHWKTVGNGISRNAMIDTSKERLLSMNEAQSEFPIKPSTPTLWRWVLKGTCGVVLESVKIGGRRFTSKQAIERFIAASFAQPNRSLRGRPAKSLDRAKAVLDHYKI